MIVSGEIQPGVALSEVGLAETFGVSRTPVREALKQLHVEGLVDVRPRVGTFVSRPSRRELVELFQVKEVLEGLGARQLALGGDVGHVQALADNLRAAEQAVADEDTPRYADLVDEFHELIIAGAENEKLQGHYRMLINQLAYHRLVVSSLKRPGRPPSSVAEHRSVLDAILAKDSDGAEASMRSHVAASQRELMHSLSPLLNSEDNPSAE